MNKTMFAWQRLEGRSGHDVGRQLLAQLYKENFGGPLPEICTLDWGKPVFRDCPLYFSITHTQNHAFCVLSQVPVGIDAEELGRKINLKLAEKILSPSEYLRFDGTGECLLRFWVLKEAEAKRTGEGIRGYPNHTDFDPRDPRIQEIDGCLVAVLQGE